MFTLHTSVNAASAASGLPLAVTIAVAVTAAVAVGMSVWSLRRGARPHRRTVGICAATALVILVGAVVIGGSLTRPPAASADEDRAPRGLGHAPFELKLSGFQLPTI